MVRLEEFICYIVMNMIKIVMKLHLKNVIMAVVIVVCFVLYIQMRNETMRICDAMREQQKYCLGYISKEEIASPQFD